MAGRIILGVAGAVLILSQPAMAQRQNDVETQQMRESPSGSGRLSAGETGVGKACKLPDGSTCYPNKGGDKANCYPPGRMVAGGPWLSDNRCTSAGGTWTTNPDGKRYCRNMSNPCK